MLTAHTLPENIFDVLAAGGGSPAAINYLREAQQSKHVMLLHAVTEAADGTDAEDPGAVAFRKSFDLLARIRAANPDAGAWLLNLPNLGGWVHDCLIRLDQGGRPDLAHLACLAAATAVRAGIPFELDVPVREDRVALPGLGSLVIADPEPWILLRCNGEQLTAVGRFTVDCRALVPDDGSTGLISWWRGTPMVRAVADGLAWNVHLETGDRYLDRYSLPMSVGLSPGEIDRWRRRAQGAWNVLVCHHRAAAESIAAGVSVIVPLTAQHDTDLISATSPAAFGAIATSWPPDPVIMAETLVHETQHLKLCGLLDMVPLAEAGSDKVYAPWRQDPRPAAGLLQGVYAHLGIARFWNTQQHAEADPDDLLRAQVLFARWRSTIDLAALTLLETGCLTPHGVRFVEVLRNQGRRLESVPVPRDAQVIAEQVALDHWVTWQMRHTTFEPAEVARLASAYQHGESRAEQVWPPVRIEEDIRKVHSTVRSRLLSMRYLSPARYRELCADGVLQLSEADILLVTERAGAAVQAYRDHIVNSTDPEPGSWIGLALAVHQLPESPLQKTFAAHIALMYEIHAYLGGRVDPLALAGWLT